jgi:hypothetical protein
VELDLPVGLPLPPDQRHHERFPLTPRSIPLRPMPVVVVLRWHEGFDTPYRDTHGHPWIGVGRTWGRVRGWHAVCLEPHVSCVDHRKWRAPYDQRLPGRGAVLAVARAHSLIFSGTYDVEEAYDVLCASEEGATLRATLELARPNGQTKVRADRRILEYRWTRSVDEVIRVTHQPAERDHVRAILGWGPRHERYVKLPLDSLRRLAFEEEGGEAAVVTDIVGGLYRHPRTARRAGVGGRTKRPLNLPSVVSQLV